MNGIFRPEEVVHSHSHRYRMKDLKTMDRSAPYSSLSSLLTQPSFDTQLIYEEIYELLGMTL
jgi:hypothetical protein